MEFPQAGKRCSAESCKQLDFLPVTCDYCHAPFCKTHFHASSHKCQKHESNVVTNKSKTPSHVCSHEDCTETFPIEMQCVKCKKHYCVQHRYHGCIEITDDEKATKLKKWQIPKKQFAEAKARVEQEISDNLKKAKNTAMANKVRLMRVKGSAVGPKNVPTNERCYFLVYPPVTASNKTTNSAKGVYVNMNWTTGRAIDAIADILKVSNKNNVATAAKLQVYHHLTGDIICNDMETPLSKLLESTQLIDGQTIILEYETDEPLDISLYK